MHLLFLAPSVLMRQLRHRRARRWTLEHLTTIGQACRAVTRQTLRSTIDRLIARVQVDGWNARKIREHVA